MAGAVVLASGVETWGTVGQWFSGGVSAIAVGVALWVALRDRRRYADERRDEQKRQARLLIVKPVVVSDRYMRIALHNRSNEPLPSVWIPTVFASADDQDARWANTANEAWLKGYPGFFELDAQERWQSDTLSFAWPKKPEPRMSDCTFHIKVEYMDARGLLWSRWDRGEPVRQKRQSFWEFRRKVLRLENDDEDD